VRISRKDVFRNTVSSSNTVTTPSGNVSSQSTVFSPSSIYFLPVMYLLQVQLYFHSINVSTPNTIFPVSPSTVSTPSGMVSSQSTVFSLLSFNPEY